MAKMIPQDFDVTTESNAEFDLFNIFRAQLPDTWYVLHSVSWVAVDPTKRFDGRGEIDFVILDPGSGVVLIEAKGGRVGVESGVWFSVDKFGQRHTLNPNPVKQLIKTTHALKDHVRAFDATAQSVGNVYFEQMVAIPGVDLEGRDLGTEAPNHLIIDRTDLYHHNPGHLAQKIQVKLQNSMARGRQEPLGRQRMTALVDLLKPSFVITVKGYQSQLESDKDKVIQLTKDQLRVVDSMMDKQRMSVSGVAGSGKTIVARELAIRHSRFGRRVLLTCHNQGLATELKSSLRKYPKIQICTFSMLLQDTVGRLRLQSTNQAKQELDEFYGTLLPELLLTNRIPDNLKFDAIVVDEGQDFRRSWWSVIDHLLADASSSYLAVFSDINQRIFDSTELPNDLQAPHTTFNTCFRSSRQIVNLAMQYVHSPVDVQTVGPDSEEVQMLPANPGNCIERFSSLISKLVLDESVDPESITVLTPKNSKTTQFVDSMQVGPLKLKWGRRVAGTLNIRNIHAFKGLSSPIVIIVEPEKMPSRRQSELTHVALLRAQSLVFVVGSLPTPPNQQLAL